MNARCVLCGEPAFGLSSVLKHFQRAEAAWLRLLFHGRLPVVQAFLVGGPGESTVCARTWKTQEPKSRSLSLLCFASGIGHRQSLCPAFAHPHPRSSGEGLGFQAGASSSEWIELYVDGASLQVPGSLLIVYHFNACKKVVLHFALVTFVGFVHPDCCLHDLVC